jgi:hypothetical protein
MTQVMAAGQSRTWRIPITGDAQAAASDLLASLSRLPSIEAAEGVFRISNCPGSSSAATSKRGCVECRLEPSDCEADAIKIVEDNAALDSLDTERAEQTVAVIITVSANAAGDLSGNELSGLAAAIRRLAEARRGSMEPFGFPVFIVRTERASGTDQATVGGAMPNRLLEESGLANDPSARFIDVRIVAVGAPASDHRNEIASLFSRVLSAGIEYGRSTSRAYRRLAWTSAGSSAAVVVMLLLALGLSFRSEASALSLELNGLRLLVANRRGWLHEPFEPKVERLLKVENDPDFSTLGAQDQTFIRDSRQELQDYREYRAKLLDVDLNRPRNKANLVALQTELTSGRLAVPEPYRDVWQHTNADDYHAMLLMDLTALQGAIDEAVTWYVDESGKLNRLHAFSEGRPRTQSDWAGWLSRSQHALDARWPHSAGDPLSGGAMLTYVAVIQSPGLQQAHRQWVVDRDRLEQLRALVLVLGLREPPPNGKQPPLALGPGFRADESAARLAGLRRLAPDLEQGSMPSLPEAIIGDVRQILADGYRNLIQAGRAVIQQHFEKLNAGENTWRECQKLLPYLGQPDDLLAWRTLTRIVQRLRGEPSADPISALATFLKHDHFDVDPQEAELRVPITAAVAPSSPLVIQARNARWSFAMSGEPERDKAGFLRYRFQRDKGTSAVFVPGDPVHGSLLARRSDNPGQWSLVWDRPVNSVWAFDALARPPRWVETNGSSGANDPAPSIRLILLPAAGWPSIPDLLPATDHKRSP